MKDSLRNGRLRVVVADDTSESLQTMATLLRKDCEVVAELPDGISALDAIRKFKPDVAVLDYSMPGLNGIEVTREALLTDPPPAVIICSVCRDLLVIQAAADAGALGYVFKVDLFRDLVRAVESVAKGHQFLPASLELG